MDTLKSKWIITAGLALALGACASKPKVEEEPQVQPPVSTPTPTPTPTQTTPPPVTPEGPAPGTVADFRINVGERVYFDTDGYNVDSYDMETLNRQAAWLQQYPSVTIRVAGNADERGTREYNLALGERRANAVKEYLVSRGISSSRIETISYGKERPIDGRSTPEAWEVNRNAHTEILSGQIG